MMLYANFSALRGTNLTYMHVNPVYKTAASGNHQQQNFVLDSSFCRLKICCFPDRKEALFQRGPTWHGLLDEYYTAEMFRLLGTRIHGRGRPVRPPPSQTSETTSEQAARAGTLVTGARARARCCDMHAHAEMH